MIWNIYELFFHLFSFAYLLHIQSHTHICECVEWGQTNIWYQSLRLKSGSKQDEKAVHVIITARRQQVKALNNKKQQELKQDSKSRYKDQRKIARQEHKF